MSFWDRIVKLLFKIGNIEREVYLGYVEDELFWLCIDYLCGDVWYVVVNVGWGYKYLEVIGKEIFSKVLGGVVVIGMDNVIKVFI